MANKHKENSHFYFHHPFGKREGGFYEAQVECCVPVVSKTCKRGGTCDFMTVVQATLTPPPILSVILNVIIILESSPVHLLGSFFYLLCLPRQGYPELMTVRTREASD